jgi:hypothetical protein
MLKHSFHSKNKGVLRFANEANFVIFDTHLILTFDSVSAWTLNGNGQTPNFRLSFKSKKPKKLCSK